MNYSSKFTGFDMTHVAPMFTWIRSRNCGCLVTWFCYQLIAKPSNKTATVPWPDPHNKLAIRIDSQVSNPGWSSHKCSWLGSDNDFLPDQPQIIIWTKIGSLLIGPLWMHFREIRIEKKNPTISIQNNEMKNSVRQPHEENHPLKIRVGFWQDKFPPLSTARVLIDAVGLCLLRVNEVWRLFAPDLRIWINSFSGSDFKPRLVYKTWYFCFFLHKLWPAVLDKVIAYIVIKNCHCIAIKIYFVLLRQRVNFTQRLSQLTN